MPHEVQHLLGALPPHVRHPLAEALAYTNGIAGKRTPADNDAEDRLYGAALAAAGLSRSEGLHSRRRIPRAETLDEVQRLVAEVLARTPGPVLYRDAVPGAVWVRRQWLGLDPPGPLFRVEVAGVPFYHAIREALVRSEGDALALFAALSPADRAPVLCDLELARVDYFEVHLDTELQKPLPDLGASAGAWAVDFAERLLALFAPGQPKSERGGKDVPSVELRRAAFVSLVRAGVTIEPRWDGLLPLARFMPADERYACVDAIPEARRAAALEIALSRVFFDGERVRIAVDLLPHHPYAGVAQCVLAALDSAADSERVLQVVRKVAADHPAVAAAAKPYEAKLARAPKLRVTSRMDPLELGKLDALQRKQLEAANRRYGGKKRTAEQIFAAPDEVAEVILPRLASVSLLENDKGKRTHDAWLYMGDSGTIFKAGTTTVVAEIVQGSLECSNLGLKLALKAALASE